MSSPTGSADLAGIPLHEYHDLLGNICWRFVAPRGLTTVRYDAVVEVPETADPVVHDAVAREMAIGRDYRDVPPHRGAFRGQAEETLSVEVATAIA